MEQTEEFLRERERNAMEEWRRKLVRCPYNAAACAVHVENCCVFDEPEATWADVVSADGNGNPR